MTRRNAIAIVIVFASIVSACGGSGRSGAAATSSRSAVAWPELFAGFQRGDDNVCTRGEVACLDAVITEMQRRLDDLVATCDHLALFALMYLRATQGVKALVEGGTLDDPRFMTRLDAGFAQLYFSAFDDWRAGRKDAVPVAWQTAFEAGDHKAVRSIGNLLLAMNVHITRDLPVALVGAGLPPDGGGHLADFRAINGPLSDRIEPLLDEVGGRFDPVVSEVDAPGIAVGKPAFVEVLVKWRDASFVDGKRLSAAGADRTSVETQINVLAATQSLAIRAATSYLPLSHDAAIRDAYCRQHGAG